MKTKSWSLENWALLAVLPDLLIPAVFQKAGIPAKRTSTSASADW